MPRRARIEAPARRAYRTLRYHRTQRRDGAVHIYEADVPVPGYESRHVTIEFTEALPASPSVFVDGPAGPEASPHRFATRGHHRVCIWYAGDPEARRWAPDDGLLTLLGMTAHHLFKEAWWRETGEWLGEERPHGELPTCSPTE